MRCPTCGVDHDRVIDSRASEDGYATRRRRECLKCKRRYTTYERLEDAAILVVKKAGIREPFLREKLRQGLEKACWKRSVRPEQLDAIIAEIEHEVYSTFDSEVESRLLGDMAMEMLRDVDEVAYVRFASVYRQFKDVRDFVHELQPMLRIERPDD